MQSIACLQSKGGNAWNLKEAVDSRIPDNEAEKSS